MSSCEDQHPPDAPAKAKSRPAGLRVEASFCAAIQELDGGSHGGGGLWEGGGTIQGESALGALSSFQKITNKCIFGYRKIGNPILQFIMRLHLTIIIHNNMLNYQVLEMYQFVLVSQLKTHPGSPRGLSPQLQLLPGAQYYSSDYQ